MQLRNSHVDHCNDGNNVQYQAAASPNSMSDMRRIYADFPERLHVRLRGCLYDPRTGRF